MSAKPTFPTLFQNGDFEDGFNGWSIKSTDNGIYLNEGVSEFETVQGVPSNAFGAEIGQYNFIFEGPDEGAIISQKIKPQSDGYITISADISTIAAVGNFDVSVILQSNWLLKFQIQYGTYKIVVGECSSVNSLGTFLSPTTLRDSISLKLKVKADQEINVEFHMLRHYIPPGGMVLHYDNIKGNKLLLVLILTISPAEPAEAGGDCNPIPGKFPFLNYNLISFVIILF